MKLKPEKLKIAQKYFLIDYEKDVVIEGVLSSIYLNERDEISYGFRHSFTPDEESEEGDYRLLTLYLREKTLMEDIGPYYEKIWVENPLFLTREEAEAKGGRYVRRAFAEVRKAILAELEENTKRIKQTKCKN